MRTPYVLIKDVNLLKQFTVKQFDRRQLFDESMDPIMGNSLVAMSGSKWKAMRAYLSPAFTGSKMRLMFNLVRDVTDQLTGHLKEQCADKPSVAVEYNVKNLCAKYTNDLIAVCAFGIKVDSLKDPENEFYKAGNSMMGNQVLGVIKFMALRFLPGVMKALKITLVSAKIREFFSGMVIGSMEYREKNKIVHPDMINLLMEAKKGHLKQESTEEDHHTIEGSQLKAPTNAAKPDWTEDEIVAQCVTFFLAGFETSAVAMSLATYELAVNAEVQQKLFEEIQGTHESLNGGPISYEKLRALPYLDQVVNETLRKWPPAPVIDRIAHKKFDYVDEETGLEMHFEKGCNIWIPIQGFHYDPKHFPEPEKFMPERFSAENKHMMNADAYIPFGIGPRSCIANRFALMEVKAYLYNLLLEFEIVVSEKTKVPLKVTNNMGAIANDMFVGMKLRGL